MSIAYSSTVRTQLAAVLILLCTGCVDPKVERYQLTTPSTSTAAGPPAILSLTATPGIGASAERATIGVRLADAANLPIANAAVQLSTTAGRLESERLTTSADGKASTLLISAVRASVTASSGTLTKTIDVDGSSGYSIILNARSGFRGDLIPISVSITKFNPDLQISVGRLDFGDGSNTALAFEGNPPTASTSHRYDRNGSYTVVATITDSLGITQQASSVVTIIDGPAPPPPPTAPAPSYQVSLSVGTSPVAQGSPTILTATVVVQDGAPPVTSYDWDCDNDGILEASSSPLNTQSCTFLSAGSKTAKVTAKGGTVQGSTTGTVMVTALPALSVAITASAGHTSGNPITFTATVTSIALPTGTLQWQWDDTNDGTVEVTQTGLNPNVHTTTYFGASTTPRVIKVRVYDPATGREATSTLSIVIS
jgi:hypothetical protein